MPIATSAATEALAYTLAALRAELERKGMNASHTAARAEEPSVLELIARIHRLGPWQAPNSDQLTEELFDAEGLPA